MNKRLTKNNIWHNWGAKPTERNATVPVTTGQRKALTTLGVGDNDMPTTCLDAHKLIRQLARKEGDGA